MRSVYQSSVEAAWVVHTLVIINNLLAFVSYLLFRKTSAPPLLRFLVFFWLGGWGKIFESLHV